MDRRDWNPLYTLRWYAADGEHQIVGTSRDIHLNAGTVGRRGGARAWSIAVLDEADVDVTGRFFNHLDRAT